MTEEEIYKYYEIEMLPKIKDYLNEIFNHKTIMNELIKVNFLEQLVG